MITIYGSILAAKKQNKKLLAVLIDPEKFDISQTPQFLEKIPDYTTHLFVGGSTGGQSITEQVVVSLKKNTPLPVVLFPGNASQISGQADALLFLSLISGDNPEYLIGQHLKAVPLLRKTVLEVIPTAYILIDGGTRSAVARVSNTQPVSQEEVKKIRDLALAGYYSGKKVIYLEAGSGAQHHVRSEIIQTVRKNVYLPLLVGGGIVSQQVLQEVFEAGADMAVIGTAFENNTFK